MSKGNVFGSLSGLPIKRSKAHPILPIALYLDSPHFVHGSPAAAGTNGSAPESFIEFQISVTSKKVTDFS